ncbi:serine/threonine protein kinase PKH2 [Sugiyamaella lignohabitans]|uniref:non-specific serine/threonine protein kinase n=1 Tax=Sugiyamaella lignohabitans TaxID=796027 RepID=A0A167C8X5_9ASCO|nr:serine/threonine protein kinase PKH2 [Sugiyamaella lignohabitans]ANB11372.1 serine/threonine protein kinase PKH2 [Sugiyamaella lignohabitans]
MESSNQYVTTGIDPKPSNNPFHNPFHRRHSRKPVAQDGRDSPGSPNVVPVLHRSQSTQAEPQSPSQSPRQHHHHQQMLEEYNQGRDSYDYNGRHQPHRHHRHNFSNASADSHVSSGNGRSARPEHGEYVSVVSPSPVHVPAPQLMQQSPIEGQITVVVPQLQAQALAQAQAQVQARTQNVPVSHIPAQAGGLGPAFAPKPAVSAVPVGGVPSRPVSNMNEYAPEIASSSEEWKERGAATIIKSEVDESGHTTTTLIKKGVKDFTFGQTLGEGSYSTVVAASDRQTLREYAIKVLDKRHIIKEKKVKYVNIEKNSLNRLGDHPGIIKLYYTFQDERSLYFVLDFASNGELLSLIKQMGSLDEDCTRYYGAQILDAVDFMHSKGVIHRDLKPENILLDYKMRLKITDFGTAKLLDPIKDDSGKEVYPEEVRTTSFVGTAEYVSPELLTDKATDKRSDIWAFGCIIYQMIAGRPPFKAANEYQTFQKIVKLQYSYPPGFPYMVRDLVKKLLVLNPKNRLDLNQIKKHDFFAGVEWDLHSIWKKPPPRLMPYKASAKSISNPRLVSNPANRLLPSQMKLNAGQQSAAARPVARQGIPSGGVRASAAAAAALGKPLTRQAPPAHPGKASPNLQSVGAPVSTPSSTSSAAVAGATTTTPASPAKPRPSVATLKATESLKALKRAQSQPVVPIVTTNYAAQKKQRAPSTPTDLQPPQNRNGGIGMPGGGVSRVKTPDIKSSPAGVSTPGTPPNASPKLIIPPVSQVDADFASLLTHHEERILKIANIPVITSGAMGYNENEDDDREPGIISKFFNGGATKRKRRIVIVTSAARLLVCDEDRRLRLDIPIGLPQVSIRELQFNKKTNTGAFVVEAQHKCITVEDASGTSEWMAAIALAREYYAQATALSESNATTAATAAAIAVGGGRPPRGRTPSSATSEAGSRLVNTSNSTFLQKNEERRSLRRKV